MEAAPVPDVFEDALARVERIGHEAAISTEVIAALLHPKATLSASLPAAAAGLGASSMRCD